MRRLGLVGIIVVAALSLVVAGTTRTDVAEIRMTGGTVQFILETGDGGPKAVLFVVDEHIADNVYITATEADLARIEKAAATLRAELAAAR